MRVRRVSRNVIVLGWVSFFTDVASEMLYPIMPLFLVGTLGASPAQLGLIDGITEGGSSVLRWVAGALSGRFRRRAVAAGTRRRASWLRVRPASVGCGLCRATGQRPMA